MDEEYNRLFTNMIAAPLEKVIGRSLISVVYYVLNGDFPDFDTSAVNKSGGCQGIHLTFDGGQVELDWDWQRVFRPSHEDFLSPPIAFHLVARPLSERQGTVSPFTVDDGNGLVAIDATPVMPWGQAFGEPLLSVTVWGVVLPENRYSPQAVGFAFPSGQAVVAIGMTDPFSIGDGDEVLVFSGTEWTQRRGTTQADTIPHDLLIPFWRSPPE